MPDSSSVWWRYEASRIMDLRETAARDAVLHGHGSLVEMRVKMCRSCYRFGTTAVWSPSIGWVCLACEGDPGLRPPHDLECMAGNPYPPTFDKMIELYRAGYPLPPGPAGKDPPKT